MSKGYDFDEFDEFGPPTAEDLAWYIRNVVSLGYPKGRRDPEPMPGQLSLTELVMVNPAGEGWDSSLIVEFRPEGIWIEDWREDWRKDD